MHKIFNFYFFFALGGRGGVATVWAIFAYEQLMGARQYTSPNIMKPSESMR